MYTYTTLLQHRGQPDWENSNAWCGRFSRHLTYVQKKEGRAGNSHTSHVVKKRGGERSGSRRGGDSSTLRIQFAAKEVIKRGNLSVSWYYCMCAKKKKRFLFHTSILKLKRVREGGREGGTQIKENRERTTKNYYRWASEGKGDTNRLTGLVGLTGKRAKVQPLKHYLLFPSRGRRHVCLWPNKQTENSSKKPHALTFGCPPPRRPFTGGAPPPENPEPSAPSPRQPKPSRLLPTSRPPPPDMPLLVPAEPSCTPNPCRSRLSAVRSSSAVDSTWTANNQMI